MESEYCLIGAENDILCENHLCFCPRLSHQLAFFRYHVLTCDIRILQGVIIGRDFSGDRVGVKIWGGGGD